MWRFIAAAVTVAICASGALAQEQFERRVVGLEFLVENLEFTIEDLGGKVQTLQVKETATETRIELPSDILFDFDKAEIRSAAEPALKQVVNRRGVRPPIGAPNG